MAKTIAIDEEGYFLLKNGIRLTEENLGASMLGSCKMDEFGVVRLTHENEEYIVESFDKPYVARQVHWEDGQLQVQMPYHLTCDVAEASLCLDEWDRFHGMTTSKMPFVLARAAQAELFNIAEDFSDDSITLGKREIFTPPYYLENGEVDKNRFWSERYLEKPLPAWDLDGPHPELKSFLQQLKLNKQRILVPGCGYGHDAAFFAEKGHVVTAIDFSDVAIQKAKERYGHLSNLNFIQGDVFKMDSQHEKAYDIIFEHTFYCAISPYRRNELIQTWQKFMADEAHLLGIFFVVPKRTGPYFGGSEWELREKLQKIFRLLYWTRLHHSPGWRNGSELMVYAQIKK